MWKALLEVALSQARRMSRDPEAESVAGEACFEAHCSFNPSRGLTLEQWVRYVVRLRIWGQWRKDRVRKVQYKTDLDVIESPPHEADYDPDFCLLVERYVDHVAEWAIARRLGITTYALRKRLDAAKARFLERVGA